MIKYIDKNKERILLIVTIFTLFMVMYLAMQYNKIIDAIHKINPY